MTHTRTILEAAAWFREQDPETALTPCAIRTLVRTGIVPCAKVGKKYLVSIEALEAYLAGTALLPPEPAPAKKKVWRIE